MTGGTATWRHHRGCQTRTNGHVLHGLFPSQSQKTVDCSRDTEDQGRKPERIDDSGASFLGIEFVRELHGRSRHGGEEGGNC
jgi:ribonuclease I